MGSPSGYKDIGALLKALDQHRQDVNSYSTKRVKVGAKVATSPRVSLEFPFLSGKFQGLVTRKGTQKKFIVR